ncbi:MAG: hypothetical protein WC565_08305 [Parcubacteria group bacterium]
MPRRNHAPYLRPVRPCMSYEIARAVAQDAAHRQAKANHRTAWNADDYNLACRTLAALWPASGCNPHAELVKEAAKP